MKKLRKNTWWGDLTTAATLGAGFAGGSFLADRVLKDAVVKKNPITHLLRESGKSIYCTGRSRGHLWSTKDPNRVTCHACLRRMYKQGFRNPIGGAKDVFDWVTTRFQNPKHLTSAVPCNAYHITWGGKGYQCLNCGQTAKHSWDIKHLKPKDKKNPLLSSMVLGAGVRSLITGGKNPMKKHHHRKSSGLSMSSLLPIAVIGLGVWWLTKPKIQGVGSYSEEIITFPTQAELYQNYPGVIKQ